MKNKKIILLVALILSLVLLVSFGTIYFLMKRTGSKAKEDWVEKYQSQTGYKIQTNEKYIMGEFAYPEKFNALSNEYKKLTELPNLLDKYDMGEILPLLNSIGIEVNEYTKNNINDYKNIEGMVGLPSQKNGMIYFYNEKQENGSFLITAIMIDSWEISENYVGPNTIDTFINNHESILGNPQVSFEDELYENESLDFYFDKGLGFTDQYLIIYTPTKIINEDLVKSVGLDFNRGFKGCEYCKFSEK